MSDCILNQSCHCVVDITEYPNRTTLQLYKSTVHRGSLSPCDLCRMVILPQLFRMGPVRAVEVPLRH